MNKLSFRITSSLEKGCVGIQFLQDIKSDEQFAMKLSDVAGLIEALSLALGKNLFEIEEQKRITQENNDKLLRGLNGGTLKEILRGEKDK